MPTAFSVSGFFSDVLHSLLVQFLVQSPKCRECPQPPSGSYSVHYLNDYHDGLEAISPGQCVSGSGSWALENWAVLQERGRVLAHGRATTGSGPMLWWCPVPAAPPLPPQSWIMGPQLQGMVTLSMASLVSLMWRCTKQL